MRKRRTPARDIGIELLAIAVFATNLALVGAFACLIYLLITGGRG